MMDYAIWNGQLDQLKLNKMVGALNCMHDQQAILREGNTMSEKEIESKGGDSMMENTETVVRRLTPL